MEIDMLVEAIDLLEADLRKRMREFEKEWQVEIFGLRIQRDNFQNIKDTGVAVILK